MTSTVTVSSTVTTSIATAGAIPSKAELARASLRTRSQNDVAASLRGLYGAQIPGELTLEPQWWISGLSISVLGTLAADPSPRGVFSALDLFAQRAFPHFMHGQLQRDRGHANHQQKHKHQFNEDATSQRAASNR